MAVVDTTNTLSLIFGCERVPQNDFVAGVSSLLFKPTSLQATVPFKWPTSQTELSSITFSVLVSVERPKGSRRRPVVAEQSLSTSAELQENPFELDAQVCRTRIWLLPSGRAPHLSPPLLPYLVVTETRSGHHRTPTWLLPSGRAPHPSPVLLFFLPQAEVNPGFWGDPCSNLVGFHPYGTRPYRIEIWDLATESFPTSCEFGLHQADCLSGREQRCQPRLGRWERGTKTPSMAAAQEVVWARRGFRRRRRRRGTHGREGLSLSPPSSSFLLCR
ncbi:hypothetical protein U1Q18_032019 [Sarracenia purpurea var. burkii]